MENKKGSLATILLVIAIILIVVMGALLYMQKTEADRQIAELENNASKLQETINDLQGKIDTISNTINANASGEIDNSQSNNTVQNNQENVNKCYTDGKYYWLMLYKTNLNNVPDSKTSPAKEQRTFSLMVNHGYGQQHLYGWYNIENDKIELIVDNVNYNYVNNTANMMTQGNNVEVKENGEQYIITLDYTAKVIKYGPYDLKVQSN